MAPPGDRGQRGLARLDQEHRGPVGLQGGDPARHQQVGDLGGRQRARELGGEGLQRREPACLDRPVATKGRSPEGVGGRGRNRRDRGPESGGQPADDRLPASLHRAEMVAPGHEVAGVATRRGLVARVGPGHRGMTGWRQGAGGRGGDVVRPGAGVLDHGSGGDGLSCVRHRVCREDHEGGVDEVPSLEVG